MLGQVKEDKCWKEYQQQWEQEGMDLEGVRADSVAEGETLEEEVE